MYLETEVVDIRSQFSLQKLEYMLCSIKSKSICRLKRKVAVQDIALHSTDEL